MLVAVVVPVLVREVVAVDVIVLDTVELMLVVPVDVGVVR